jgi:2-oxoglutarate/2-oxoacid ferredoxin oxidoreductase subunit beta
MTEERKTYESYLVEQAVFPFCKGCGHTHSVKYLDHALKLLQRDPTSVSLVSDIGCIGLVDALFADIHTVHTTHGRSTAFATGIEIADSILYDSDLKTIVILGDGGATIGLLHIVTAAQMNVDITVIVCNNFLYGMTGGQHSAFTPDEMKTATTPFGNIIPPLDICRLVESSGAGFVARTLATNRELPDILAKAIDYPGFALVEIVELCTEYGTKKGGIDGRKLKAYTEHNKETLGILVNRTDRSEFSALYKKSIEQAVRMPPKKGDEFLVRAFNHSLDRQMGIILAGTAGEHVQLASYLFMKAAISSGMIVSQKNDNPVTQGTGFSISELILSPEEIYFTGIGYPDVIIVSSRDGLNEIIANGMLDKADEHTLILADEGLSLDSTIGNVQFIPLRKTLGSDHAAVGGLGVFLHTSNIMPIKCFADELKIRFKEKAGNILEQCNKIAIVLNTIKTT